MTHAPETTTVADGNGPITRAMSIADVVRAYPAAAETLTAFGIHCVGCRVSQFETLEQGLGGHGLSDANIDLVVAELNASVAPAAGVGGLRITPHAITHLKRILAEKGLHGKGLRVEVLPGGCSGMQYGFDLEETAREDDTVIELDSVKIYVDAQSMEFLRGATIDYVDALQGAGFRISNPNAKRSCGCGQSFGA